MRKEPYKVLIADDSAAVREALRWALEVETDLAVVGEASDGLATINRTTELGPDAVILDIEMSELDGYAVTRALKALPAPPLVIFLTVHSDPTSRWRSFAAGGDAFVEKGGGWLPLIAQIRRLLTKI